MAVKFKPIPSPSTSSASGRLPPPGGGESIGAANQASLYLQEQNSINWCGTAAFKEQVLSIDRKQDSREYGRGRRDTTECGGRMLLQSAAGTHRGRLSWRRPQPLPLSAGIGSWWASPRDPTNHPCKLHEQVTEVRGQRTPDIVHRPNSIRPHRHRNGPKRSL